MATSDKKQGVGSTMSTGAPAPSDRNSLTIGADGPILLHDVHFLEQMAHFNREKVPERQPHAKGAGAFGVLEPTEDDRSEEHTSELHPLMSTSSATFTLQKKK